MSARYKFTDLSGTVAVLGADFTVPVCLLPANRVSQELQEAIKQVFG
jgi:hypothetical protein